jgi:beta-glucanase (GH16 family)
MIRRFVILITSLAGLASCVSQSQHETRWISVWNQEFHFSNAELASSLAKNWVFRTGGHSPNGELQTYCGPSSEEFPCNSRRPNTSVDEKGVLHLIARKVAKNTYTSARLSTQGLWSFRYGRIESRIKIPKGHGLWPAFWLVGDNIEKVDWPDCGEVDIMETIGSETEKNGATIHGAGFAEYGLSKVYELTDHKSLADDFHIYGLTWSPGLMEFYIDNPANVYARFTPNHLPPGAKWPFDSGKFFVILNLAVGGGHPGNPDETTQFPAEMLVDYVRVFRKAGSQESGLKLSYGDFN